MKSVIFVLNGPNLNLLGEREPEIYGYTTLAEIKEMCASRTKAHGFELDFRQTNFEGSLIESVHDARKAAAGIIINPAGLTFTSASTYPRESFRRRAVRSGAASFFVTWGLRHA